MSLLVAASALIGNAKKVQITNDYIQPANLFCILVGPPGSKKSPAFRLVMSFIDKIEKRLKEKYNLLAVIKYAYSKNIFLCNNACSCWKF